LCDGDPLGSLPQSVSSTFFRRGTFYFRSRKEPVVATEFLQRRYGLTVTEAKLAQYLIRGGALHTLPIVLQVTPHLGGAS